MAKKYAKQFYKSKAWQRARAAALIRDKGLCQTPGCYNPAEEIHHIKEITPENINDGSITLDLTNLICLCHNCHARIHEKERHKRPADSSVLQKITFDGARPAPLLKK